MKKQIYKAEKAYKNSEFLNSPDARVIRIISEFLEPMRRFRFHRAELMKSAKALDEKGLPGTKFYEDVRQLIKEIGR